jgi:hypothetical protein
MSCSLLVPLQAQQQGAAQFSTNQHQQQQQQQHITIPATPNTSSPAAALPAAGAAGFWESSAGGWVVAMSLLVAVRQGRLAADAGRLDVKALQARQEGSRVQVIGGCGVTFGEGSGVFDARDSAACDAPCVVLPS